MRKITITMLAMMLAINLSYAGGLVTNTNQSAAWARMLVRDASTSIDAVYYNPAALTKLSDGLHISLSNQTIFQTQTLTSTFSLLNNKTYEGKVSAPIFPDVYVAYKTGRWAFSAGFMPIGGGGGAEFAAGIPMAEIPIAASWTSFSSMGVTGYKMDMYLKGTSVYFGLQAGVSFEVSENLSLYGGVRYVMAKNSYSGYVKDIEYKTASGYVRADDFMNNVGDQATAGATSATSAGNGLQNWVGSGATVAGMTFDQAVSNNVMTATQRATFEGALLAFGFSQAQIDAMTLSSAQTSFYGVSSSLTAQAMQLYAAAKLMADQQIDVTQTGHGFTPIFGANLTLMDKKLDIGLKYEFITHMSLTNSTPAGKGYMIGLNTDGTPIYMFPDGEKINADMPSMLSIGVSYKVNDMISLQGGAHFYGDRNTGWKDVKSTVGKNYQEYGLGAEFNVTPNLLLSAGYLMTITGVNQSYQSDLGFSLNTNTVGAGGAYKINDNVTVQLGGYYTMYQPKTYDYTYSSVPYQTTYKKSTFGVSLGLDFKIGK
ncbi:MAG: outer membrane beta-barrel protein [Bacteroidales bacterium]|nr:outer membrane beta-barrel protein [Bacteroidales bacterium]